MKRFLLTLPILLLVFTSGCTIPGTDIYIPDIFGSKTTEYPNDVIIIHSLKAIPSKVSPGQSLRVSAYIQNIGDEKVPQDVFKNKKIETELYDYCQGLFTIEKTFCNGKEIKSNTCEIPILYPSQVVPVEWVLRALPEERVPLKTSCDLKISVKYPYQTKSITSVTFIDYQEMQRLMNEGKYKPITSYITEGYGPIKPYLLVEDEQPIPVQNGVEGTTVFSLQIKNRGSGFLSDLNPENKKDFQYVILPHDIKFSQAGGQGRYDLGKLLEDCKNQKINEKEGLPLINKKSPKIICDDIPLPWNVNLPKESSYHVTTSLSYAYEFRSQVKVTVEPKT